MDERHEFVAVATEAAGRVAAVLAENPLRANQPYPIGAVLDVLARCYDDMRRAVAGLSTPVTIDSTGRVDPFGNDLAALMSHLQVTCVLCHRLDDIPGVLRVSVTRNLAAVHLIARRVRDGGSRLSRLSRAR